MKKKKYIFLIPVAFLVWRVFMILQNAGVFLKIQEQKPVNETVLESPAGVEDITVDQETQMIFLSAHDRRNPKSNGDIYLMKLNDTTSNIKNLTKNQGFQSFRPHGISFLKTSKNEKFLFVISHANNKDEVIKFGIEKDSLILLNKYSSSEFISSNDILAVGENQFFLTNDHTRKDDILRKIGDFINFPSGNVVYFDGEKTRIVSEGIPYANGINLSPNGEFVYVSSTTTNRLHVYRPNLQTKKLETIEKIKLKYSPDNIEIDQNGNLLIGCHPKLLQFLSHKKSESNRSASAVLSLAFKDNLHKEYSENTIYLSNGNPLSGLSVAAQISERSLILGSVFEKKVVILNLPLIKNLEDK
jgi:arylesterase/paraoxonase